MKKTPSELIKVKEIGNTFFYVRVGIMLASAIMNQYALETGKNGVNAICVTPLKKESLLSTALAAYMLQ